MKKYLLSIVIILLACLFISNCKDKPKEIWTCPMHPDYISELPGQCPICNMSLVKKEPQIQNKKKNSPDGHEHGSHSDMDKSKPEKSIQLSEEKQALIGIKTEKVEIRALTKKINAYSRVAYDPELYTAIQEYKEIRKISRLTADEPETQQDTILNSSIIRLKQLGLSDSQINEWSNKNPDVLILGSKNGRAYIYSSIYESDINYIKTGQKVTLKIDSYPDRVFPGFIQSIDPILDEKNRTLRFRSYVQDKENMLKPQMFGSIEISIPMKKALSIPKSAIMNTGKDKLAYKKIDGDRFIPVMVKTGMETDDYYEVIEGLTEGEDIVVESNFLLDSESKIKLGGSSSEHQH